MLFKFLSNIYILLENMHFFTEHIPLKTYFIEQNILSNDILCYATCIACAKYMFDNIYMCIDNIRMLHNFI